MAETGTRTYNKFYNGIKQDDFLTNGANLIDTKNLTGLRTGYGVTLGPKVEKVISVLDKPLSLFIGPLSTGELFRSFTGDLLGNIYRLDGADDTPSHTLTAANGNTAITRIVRFDTNFYFFRTNPSLTDTFFDVVKVDSTIDVPGPPSWIGVDETFETGRHVSNSPILVAGDLMYWSAGSTSFKSLTKSGIVTTFSFLDDYPMGFSQQGTQIKIYARDGTVYFWDGVNTNFTSSQKFPFRIANMVQQAGIDYVTSEDGDLYISSGYSMQRLTEAKKSRRLEDNSDYVQKLNLAQVNYMGNPIFNGKGDPFFVSNNDGIKGIYQFGNIIEGLPKGQHKTVTENSLFQSPDFFHEIQYYSRGFNQMYFGWTKGTEFGIDFFQIDGLATSKDGFGVTEVFTGGTTLTKAITKCRLTSSYTSGNNFVKLYFRKNNELTWNLARTINEQTDEISRKSITEITGNFIDIQFKIELHNDNQDDTPPIVQELYFEYIITENNG